MRVVAGDAVTQPEYLLHAEIVAENFVIVLATEAGVALLRFAQQAFFGCQQGAPAVDVDAAAFKHHATAFMRWFPCVMFERLVDERRGDRVAFVIAVFRPSVESPVRVGERATRIFYRDWAGVAHPAAVSRHAEEIYVR